MLRLLTLLVGAVMQGAHWGRAELIRVAVYPSLNVSDSYQATFDHIGLITGDAFTVDQLSVAQYPGPQYQLYLANVATKTCLEMQYEMVELATVVKGNSSFYGGQVVSNRTLSISTLCDGPLSGVNVPSLGGFVLQYEAFLTEFGYDLLQHCDIILHSSPQAVLDDLQAGRANAGLLPSTLLNFPNSLNLGVQFVTTQHSIPQQVSTTLLPQQSIIAPVGELGAQKLLRIAQSLVGAGPIGDISGWTLPLSSNSVSTTLSSQHFIQGNWCTSSFYSSIVCGPGLRKRSYAQSLASCKRLQCASATCLCKVCQPKQSFVVPLSVSLGILLFLTFCALATAVLYHLRYVRRASSDADLTRRALIAFGRHSCAKVGAIIGCGAHATVYTGSYNGLPVAFKVCDTTTNVSEASLGIAVHHDNIVETYAYAILTSSDSVVLSPDEADPSQLWLVLERCEGSIGHLLGQLSLYKAVRILRHVAEGLQYLHKVHIIHGDINCNNILMKQHVAKIGDLGLVRTTNHWSGTSLLTRHALGTVTHMAPELIVTGELSKQVDIFAYGVVAWELAHNQKAWCEQAPASIIAKVLRNENLPISPTLALPFRRLIERCTHAERTTRATWPEIQTLLANCEAVVSLSS